MTNFIYNDTDLPIDKINLSALPPGANPRQWVVNTEWITVCQALLDVQSFCRGANWLGLATSATDPVPAAVTNYMWLKSDGTLWKTVSGTATEIGNHSSTLVYAPGSDTTGPVVFEVWGDLIDKLTELRTAAPDNGAYMILFDDTDGAITIPTGTYDMTNVVWKGIASAPAVVFEDDAVVTGLREIVHIDIDSSGWTTTAPISDLVDGDKFYLTDHALIGGGGGSSAVIDLDSLEADGTVTFCLRHGSEIYNNGVPPIACLSVTANRHIRVEVDQSSAFEENVVTDGGSGLGFLEIHWEGSNEISALQTQWTGGISFFNNPNAYNVVADQTPTVIDTAGVYTYDPTGAPLDVFLDAASKHPGIMVYVKNRTASTNAITITPDGSDTIDGAATKVISSARGVVHLISDGVSDWLVI